MTEPLDLRPVDNTPVIRVRRVLVGYWAKCHGTRSYDWSRVLSAWRPSRDAAVAAVRRKADRVLARDSAWEEA